MWDAISDGTIERFFELQLRRYLAGQPLQDVFDLEEAGPVPPPPRTPSRPAQPMVSIVVPTYKTLFLDQALQSALALSAVRRHPDQLSNASVTPLAFRSVASWFPLATDANALGLLADEELLRALKALLPMFRRWQESFPALALEAAAAAALVEKLGASTPSRGATNR